MADTAVIDHNGLANPFRGVVLYGREEDEGRHVVTVGNHCIRVRAQSEHAPHRPGLYGGIPAFGRLPQSSKHLRDYAADHDQQMKQAAAGRVPPSEQEQTPVAAGTALFWADGGAAGNVEVDHVFVGPHQTIGDLSCHRFEPMASTGLPATIESADADGEAHLELCVRIGG